MKSSAVRWRATVLTGLLIVIPGFATPSAAPQVRDQAPTFRGAVTVVPVDVRVLDRDGRPVTDLTRDDFVIFENDVRQPIVHFAQQVLTPRPPGPDVRAHAEVPAFDDSTPQQHRIFLIVLGSGAFGSRPFAGMRAALPDPSKAIDGLLHLVRERLLPQDQVALLVYNRATDFTADHERVATVLDAFKRSEDEGRAALARWSAPTPTSSPAASAFGAADTRAALQPELGLAEYLAAANRPLSDLDNLYYGVKYLRFMEGEKHLLYVTAQGIQQTEQGRLPILGTRPWEPPERLAETASDARVALHTIQTGGISSGGTQLFGGVWPQDPFLRPLPIMTPSLLAPGQPYFGSLGNGNSGSSGGSGQPHAIAAQPGFDRPAPDAGVPIPGSTAGALQRLSDLRTLARLTGGTASIMELAAQAVDRVDATTRSAYLLAYYPLDTRQDGRFRTVSVEVNRKDVTVLFRHGYSAQPPAPALTRRAVLANGQIASAALLTKDVRDIPVTLTPTFTKARTGNGGEMLVQVQIDATRLGWVTDDLSRRVAHLDLVVFCGDKKQTIVGQVHRTIDTAFTGERYEQAIKDGLRQTLRVPVTAPARYVKAIVYSYEANLSGSVLATMK
jgi:VWFA-related protein